MPTLLYDYEGTRHGGIIDGRVLIGRRLTHGVIVVDPAVSRLHAWIAKDEDGYYMLSDAGSRTGTFVNGQTVTRHELQDGDRIEVGPAVLTFLHDDELPDDAEPVILTDKKATVQSSHAGILFDCACGAPLWVGNELAGKRGLCRYCGETVVVPKPSKGGRRSKPVSKPRPATAPVLAKVAVPEPPPVLEPMPAVEEPISPPEEVAVPAVEPSMAPAESIAPFEAIPEIVDEQAPPVAEIAPIELAAVEAEPVEAEPVEAEPIELPPEPSPVVRLAPPKPAAEQPAFTPRFVPLDLPTGDDLLGDDPEPPSVFADVRGLSESRVDEVAALAIEQPASHASTPLAACGVCHSGIEADEETTTCPDCRTTFHADCWLENYGCSTYGCPQVNAIKPASVKSAEERQDLVLADSTADNAAVAFPLELVFLAGSAIGSLIGALLFGAVPLLVTLLALGVLATRPLRRPGMLLLAILVGLAGTLGGVALSDFYWFDGRHLAMLHW